VQLSVPTVAHGFNGPMPEPSVLATEAINLRNDLLEPPRG